MDLPLVVIGNDHAMRLHHIRRGTGAPLLLVHGIGDTNRVWSPVLGRLARAHECLAIDAPGFGRSAGLDGGADVEAMARACAAFMRERGHETFHVAGNSMGGAIALELARAGAARSATALSPSGFAAGWERTYTDISLRLTRALTEVIAPVAGVLARPAPARRLLTAQMVRDGARMRPEEVSALVRSAATAPAFDAVRGPLSRYRFPDGVTFGCPVTVAWGSHDFLLLTRPQSARARERLPSARHLILQGCGHLPTWDDPEQVVRAILETTAAGG
jgi:pimeloyl-ACP methyl ester carboxylesterase